MAEIQGYGALIRRLNAVGSPKATQGLLAKLANAAIAKEKAAAPKRTGNLRRSIHVGAVSTSGVQLIASANYAGFVEYGTRPHEITPNAAKALRWAASSGGRRLTGTPTKAAQRGGAGGLVFARKVHHPGTRAHPFMLEGARAAVAASPLANAIVAAWNEAT